MIAEDGGFAVANEREFASFDSIAGVFGLFFGEADGADLRFAISGVANAGLQELLRGKTLNVSDGDDSFHHGGMSELRHHAGDDVTHGEQAGLGGLKMFIDVNEAAIELGFGFFEAAIFGEGFAANR